MVRAPTPSWLADRAAIHDLVKGYALFVDGFQLEDTVACWSADGIFDERENGLDLYAGQAALRRLFGEILFPELRTLVHLMCNHLVRDIDGDRAFGTAFVLCEAERRDGRRSRMQSMYEDEYRRVDGHWKFARRTIHARFTREIVITSLPG